MTWRRLRLCARSARQGSPASPKHWSGGSTGESGAASSSCAARSCRESDRGGAHARRMWLPSSQREIVVRGNEQPPGASRTGTSDGAPARSPRASQAAATGRRAAWRHLMTGSGALPAMSMLAWAACRRWLTGLWRARRRPPCQGGKCCWRPSCMCPVRRRVLCRVGVWWRRWGRAWCGGGCWFALQRDSARRRCWPTGPAVIGGQWRGWAWMAATATRPGSGGMWWPRWTRPGRGWPGGGPAARPAFPAFV